MARIRSIKPSIWTDERFVQLSPTARLLVLGMISHADDDGRLLASPQRLGGIVFPTDDFTPARIKAWRDEIADVGLIKVYMVGKVEYACFPRWQRHQRISKPQPSTLPSPNGVGSHP